MNFPINGIDNCNFNFELKEIPIQKNNLFIKYNEIIRNKKEEIDKLENVDNWDKMKKIGNPYELIYTSYNKKRKNDSISSYIPISRSYFKLWEIFYNFDLFKEFDKNSKFIFSHLAEGPGGFMEATYNYMKKINKTNNYYYGITLKPNNEYVPDWNKIKKTFEYDKKVHIDYGNLYIYEDVMKYISKFKGQNKATLVTSDGGFDYSNNFNGQEISSCQIIYSEIVIALSILDYKGCFIIKVFDLFSITSCQMMMLIIENFEKINIYKPETSRPANSEKYLICQGFTNNLTKEQINKYLNIIKVWNNLSLDETKSIIFNNFKLNNLILYKINEYNKIYIDKQLYFLNNTIKITQIKPTKDEYYNIIKNQVSHAIKWCEKYNIEINKNSIYYKKNYYDL
jgi:23S rRNA U2552 (ribose-2'-O)-methylase RlmE/FtsJ